MKCIEIIHTSSLFNTEFLYFVNMISSKISFWYASMRDLGWGGGGGGGGGGEGGSVWCAGSFVSFDLILLVIS